MLPSEHVKIPELPDYLAAVISETEDLQLQGISPKVNNRVVRIRTDSVYVPLRGIRDPPLYEELGRAKGPTRNVALAREYDDPQTDSNWNLYSLSDDEATEPSVDAQVAPSVEMAERIVLEIPRLVIIGHPGSGKSTWTRHIAYCLAKRIVGNEGGFESLPVPILVKPSRFGDVLTNRPDLGLREYLTQSLTSRFGRVIDSALGQGRALVILDGIDEIPRAEVRSKVLSEVNRFSHEFPHVRILLTSRVVSYRRAQLGSEFSVFSLCPFGWREARKLLRAWNIAILEHPTRADAIEAATKEADALLHAIAQNPGIRRLASNPLLLTIIALCHRRGTELPSRRVTLYRIIVDTLLDNWPLRSRTLELKARDVERILQPVAFEMIRSGTGNSILESDLLKILAMTLEQVRVIEHGSAIERAESVLEEIQEKTGFFQHRGYSSKNQSFFGFLHTTLMEFLAAEHLLEQWHASREAFPMAIYIGDLRWYEVLLLMGGLSGESSQTNATNFIELVLSSGSPDDNMVYRPLFMSAGILAEDVGPKLTLVADVANGLCNVALTTSDPAQASAVCTSLREISEVQPIEGLLRVTSMNDQDSQDIRSRKAVLKAACGDATPVRIEDLAFGLFSDTAISNEAAQLLRKQENRLTDEPKCLLVISQNGGWMPVEISSTTAAKIRDLHRPGLVACHPSTLESGTLSEHDHLIVDGREYASLGQEKLVALFSKAKETFPLDFVKEALTLSAESGQLYCSLSRTIMDPTSDAETRLTLLGNLEMILPVYYWRRDPAPGVKRSIDTLGQLVKACLGDADERIRQAALSVASCVYNDSDPEFKDAVSRGLKDQSESVQKAAIQLSLQRPFRESLTIPPPLREFLKPSVSGTLRAFVARELATFGNFGPGDDWELLDALKPEVLAVPNIQDAARLWNGLFGIVSQSSTASSFESATRSLLRIARDHGIDLQTATDADFNTSPFLLFRAGSVPFPVEPIIRMLQHETGPKESWVLDAVWMAAQPETFPSNRMLEMLVSDKEVDRGQALTCLWKSGVPSEMFVDPLFEIADQGNKDDQVGAYLALTDPRDEATFTAIVARATSRLKSNPRDQLASQILWKLIGPSVGRYG